MNITEPVMLSAIPGLWHEFAAIFPMMEGEGLSALEADIREHGVREPVIQFEGKILDGRNRYFVAHGLDMALPVAQFEGTRAEALAFVVSHNLHRRHLTESQRAMIGTKLASMRQGERTDLEPSANLPVSQAQAAQLLNVSERSIRAAKTVTEHGAPELVTAVVSGDVSVSAAEAIAHLPAEEQRNAVAAGPAAVKAKAKLARQSKAKPPADPDEDPEIAKARKALAKLTPDALIDDMLGLRADMAEAKKTIAVQRAEIADLKARLADATDSDSGAVIRRLQASVKQAENEKWRQTEETAAAKRQVHALKKRVAELEAVEIPLN